MTLSRRLVVGAASVVAFLILWQFVGQREIVRSDLISYPTEVFSTFIHLTATGELGTNASVTLQEFIEGFVPSIVLGVIFGVVLALVKPLRELLDPLLTAIYTAPTIAFIPILVVWFGVGTYSCLLYTSDAADDLLCVDLGGRRIIKK